MNETVENTVGKGENAGYFFKNVFKELLRPGHLNPDRAVKGISNFFYERLA